jgi:transposase
METMAAEYCLDDAVWAAIEPLLPRNQPGARRVDDRRVISGIVHVLRSGCRWKDCPAIYGPPTTIYNRWNRWSGRGLWMRIFQALADARPADLAMIDSSAVKAQRASAGGKGGLRPRQSAARAAAARQRFTP